MSAERLRLRDVRHTTPFRLSLLFGALILSAILATLVLSYVLTARELTARSDRMLAARAASLLKTPADDLPAQIRAELASAPAGFSYIALRASDGETVIGNIRLDDSTHPSGPFTIDPQPGVHGPLRVLEVRTAHGETIVLARDISQVRDLRGRLVLILAVSGLVSTIATLAIAIMLSLAPLRRVRDLRRASRAIAAGDLARRMPIADRHDELDQFATTVNMMVEEVTHVIAQVKTATDAIAHDLRTPLTRVRVLLHRLRGSDGLSAEQRDLADRAVGDLDAVIDRFAALLRIAELEASERRSELAVIDLAPLLAAVVDLYGPLAEERGIALTVDIASVRVEADAALLFEAIGNLVDNAIKFARTHIRLLVGRDGEDVVVEVRDDGHGIAAEERAAVTRRFHRARGASGVEGTGLGLAVVSAIVHLHGIALEFDDAAPGLVARLRFPAARPE